MKLGSLFVLLIFFVSSAFAQNTDGIQFSSVSWEENLTLGRDQNKIIFVDCYTSWCGPCKMLSKDIFTQKQVGDLFNKNFINVKVDMEKGEGIALRKKYNVAAFPTLLWIDNQGNELHKVVGAPTAEKLIEAANSTLAGKGLSSLERNYNKNKNDLHHFKAYITALASAYESDKIQVVLNDYFQDKIGMDLLSETNYTFLKTHLTDVESPAFVWFDQHKSEFCTKYGAEEVQSKLFQSYLGYGHNLISKNRANKELCQTRFDEFVELLSQRNVEDNAKIVAFVKGNLLSTQNKWDDYIELIKSSNDKGYYGEPNSMYFYNWARAVGSGENVNAQNYQQAALWMEDAFKYSPWPLSNNLVYLTEKVKLLKKAQVETAVVEKEKQRIASIKEELKQQ